LKGIAPREWMGAALVAGETSGLPMVSREFVLFGAWGGI